jgi:seryl-tRNA synthetase
MHDIRYIRENPDAFDQALKRRNLPPQANEILAADSERRKSQTVSQELQAERNAVSQQIGEIKKKGGDATALMQKVSEIKERMPQLEEQEKQLGQKLDEILSSIPNIPAADVPDGKDEKDNKEIRKFGEPKRINSAKQHFELGEALGLMDFNTAAKLSGARFTLLRGALARLERALYNFMLDQHTKEFGYTEISPPLMVRDEIMYGTAQLPKFAEDQFKTTTGLWLIPTSEVPLTNIVNGDIIEREKLPFRLPQKRHVFVPKLAQRVETPAVCCASINSTRSKWLALRLPINPKPSMNA